MKSHRFLTLVALLATIGSASMAFAQTLGESRVFDAKAVQNWQSAPGVSVKTTPELSFSTDAQTPFGWATPGESQLLRPGLTIHFDLSALTGTAKLQAEWLGSDDKFLGATQLKSWDKPETGEIALQAPKEWPAASKFNLKFWLEGANANAVFKRLDIGLPRNWRTPGTTTLQTIGSAEKATPDKGLMLNASDSQWTATLEKGTPYAAFALKTQLAPAPKTMIGWDISQISGAATLQVVALDKDGGFLKAIDIIKDVTRPGFYEVPIEIFEDDFGPNVAQLAPKIWVIGDGARLVSEGIFIGRTS